MAINQIWVSVNGTDTNSGATYALAKKTLAGGISAMQAAAQAKYNVLNIVNDGTHLMVTGLERLNSARINSSGVTYYQGTTYSGSDFGLLIQGVTANSTAALVTIAATRTDDRWAGLCQLYGGGGSNVQTIKYATIKGLKFDFSVVATKTAALTAVGLFRTGATPMRVVDCEIVGSLAGGTTPLGSRSLVGARTLSYTPTTTSGYQWLRNVVVNAPKAFLFEGSLYQPETLARNVVIWSTDDTSSRHPEPFAVWGLGGTLQSAFNITHNTVYVLDTYPGNESVPIVTTVATNATNIALNSNLVYAQVSTTAIVAAPLPGGMFAAGADSGNGTRGVCGYNMIMTGTNVSNESSWTSGGYYDTVFHPNWSAAVTPITAVYATDVMYTQGDPAVLFNSLSTTYTWMPDDYVHVLPLDLRPILGRYVGLNSTTVGALPFGVPPIGPDEDDPVPIYTDSTAFYRPTIKADTLAMVKVRRNKEYAHVDMRHYLRKHLHNENTLRRVTLAGNDSGALGFGGVASSIGFILETDQTLNVTLTFTRASTSVSEQFAVTVDELLVFDQAPLNAVAINNTSSVTANVQFVVFD